jgi:hypothetical protein
MICIIGIRIDDISHGGFKFAYIQPIIYTILYDAHHDKNGNGVGPYKKSTTVQRFKEKEEQAYGEHEIE